MSRTEREGVILTIPYIVCLFLCVRVVFTLIFSRVALFFVFFSLFLPLLLQYGDVEHSEKKREKGFGNVISKEREFSVSLETKKFVFLTLHETQKG